MRARMTTETTSGLDGGRTALSPQRSGAASPGDRVRPPLKPPLHGAGTEALEPLLQRPHPEARPPGPHPDKSLTRDDLGKGCLHRDRPGSAFPETAGSTRPGTRTLFSWGRARAAGQSRFPAGSPELGLSQNKPVLGPPKPVPVGRPKLGVGGRPRGRPLALSPAVLLSAAPRRPWLGEAHSRPGGSGLAQRWPLTTWHRPAARCPDSCSPLAEPLLGGPLGPTLLPRLPSFLPEPLLPAHCPLPVTSRRVLQRAALPGRGPCWSRASPEADRAGTPFVMNKLGFPCLGCGRIRARWTQARWSQARWSQASEQGRDGHSSG